MTAVFDASHGALLLDCVSLNENGRTGWWMGRGGWAAATSLKRGTEELSEPWRTIENEGERMRAREEVGDITLWKKKQQQKNPTTYQREGERERLSLLHQRLELDQSQEWKSCLWAVSPSPLLEHRQEPKPRGKDWRCLCFVSWQKMILTQTRRVP